MPSIVQRVLLFSAIGMCAVPMYAWATPHQQEQTSRRSDDEVRKEIQAKLVEEPQLKGLSISVKVDSRRVVLGGRVYSIAQRDRAIEIAHAFAEGRQVVDDFEIIPQAIVGMGGVPPYTSPTCFQQFTDVLRAKVYLLKELSRVYRDKICQDGKERVFTVRIID